MDRDGPAALDAEVMFADFLDRAASRAGHRDRSARAVGADLLAIHEPGEEHSARALGTRLGSAHRVVAARAYSSSVEVRGDAARFSAKTTGLDRCGVAGQADEFRATDDDGRVLTAPRAVAERSRVGSPTVTAETLSVDGALHGPDPATGRAGDGPGLPLASGAVPTTARRLVAHSHRASAGLTRRQHHPARPFFDQRMGQILNGRWHVRMLPLQDSGLLDQRELKKPLREGYWRNRMHDLSVGQGL
ncbi:hypothetical protein ACR5KS_00145 [Leucobacter sp. W1153]|uniref:hypothetical protein n=1 Tax=Leucobacter sp. W1153 TaxID=3439064 RepID=UPI003F2C148E